jgi:peptide alpha-N-acetyltransferase
MRLIDTELSEPYSIFTYRYFLHQWPSLCVFACDGSGTPVGTIVAKVEPHKSSGAMRGYIAMLVVQKPYRGAGTGTQLVRRAIQGMRLQGATEVVLEAETHNAGALAMYEGLGFIRDKRLERYYLSGTDAFRLKLLLPGPPEEAERLAAQAEAAAEARRLEAMEANAASLQMHALRVESVA